MKKLQENEIIDDLLRHEDGSLWQFMPKVNGHSFYCECGCNVFHKHKNNPDKYICNACDAIYYGK